MQQQTKRHKDTQTFLSKRIPKRRTPQNGEWGVFLRGDVVVVV